MEETVKFLDHLIGEIERLDLKYPNDPDKVAEELEPLLTEFQINEEKYPRSNFLETHLKGIEDDLDRVDRQKLGEEFKKLPDVEQRVIVRHVTMTIKLSTPQLCEQEPRILQLKNLNDYLMNLMNC